MLIVTSEGSRHILPLDILGSHSFHMRVTIQYDGSCADLRDFTADT